MPEQEETWSLSIDRKQAEALELAILFYLEHGPDQDEPEYHELNRVLSELGPILGIPQRG